MSQENSKHDHSIGYGAYVLVWLSLLSLTVITVAVAGIDLGGYILPVALFVAAVKSFLVINVFMHIKFDELIFKVFIGVTLLILVAVFALTAFDLATRL